MSTDDVLTGQVCANHHPVHHDAEGRKVALWCNRCGRNDEGELLGRPNGGWA